jgi:diacylglycerol kinase
MDAPSPPDRGWRSSWLGTSRCAAAGVVEAIARERNMRVHVLGALAVALVGSEVRLDVPSQLGLLVCAALVLAAELVNTALEALVDLHTRERREEARRVKDAAAGAVLVLAVGAVAVAGVVARSGWAELRLAADRLGPLVYTDAVLVVLAGTLLFAPGRRPAEVDGALVALGAAQLGFVTSRTVALPFALLAWVTFAAAAAAARWLRAAAPDSSARAASPDGSAVDGR